ncbi:unnamed protein product [Fraxinus pennsylvanica]|uniref:DUF4228 domain-containing protein n=1 Tax=Fraxinus pennsylvanica TaxID=56036 RepID=A0AAD1Z240_9LAMI|nr:unnamed protein product [Fraxinus pennsylvanica]
MGCSYSCKRSSISEQKSIRVVHFNGFVEDLEYPVTVSEVTGKPTKQFLFTHAQILSGSVPLKPETILEPGRIYFMLPYSLLQSNVSPVELAPIARKLAALAQKCPPSKTGSGGQSFSSSRQGASPVWSSPASSPNRFSSPRAGVELENDQASYAMQKSPARSWKPILATIREISFNRRSESDLQEN